MQLIAEKTKTTDEVFRLICDYQRTHDKDLQEIILRENTKLVLHAMQYFPNHKQERDDLFQIGMMGLMDATDRFDTTRGIAFSTYAVHTIFGYVKSYLSKNNPIKISRNIKENMVRIQKFRDTYYDQHHAEPTADVIMESLELTESQYNVSSETLQSFYSIDKPVRNDAESKEMTLLDILPGEDDFTVAYEEKELMMSALDSLTDEEKYIIEMRFFEEKRQGEIAEDLSVSQAHVSRMEKRALLKMKNYYAKLGMHA